MAAPELPFGHRAGDLEIAVRRVDDEGDVAPAGDRLHGIGEEAAVTEMAHPLRQGFEHRASRDTLLRRDRRDDGPGIGGEAFLERRRHQTPSTALKPSKLG